MASGSFISPRGTIVIWSDCSLRLYNENANGFQLLCELSIETVEGATITHAALTQNEMLLLVCFTNGCVGVFVKKESGFAFLGNFQLHKKRTHALVVCDWEHSSFTRTQYEFISRGIEPDICHFALDVNLSTNTISSFQIFGVRMKNK